MAVKHNLTQFARRVEKQAQGVAPAVSDMLRKVALVSNQTLVMATPVDTGRARANWRVSIGTEVSATVDSTNAQESLSRNKAIIMGYRNGDLIIQNNLPYIEILNRGSSAQAPAGFVEKALQTAARAVAKSKVIK